MSESDLKLAATKFIQADIEYVKLLEHAVDFHDKGRTGILDAELRALRQAKAKRATLEEQLYLMLDGWRVEF